MAFYAMWLDRPVLVAHRTALQIAEIDKPFAPEWAGRYRFPRRRRYPPSTVPAYIRGQRRSLRKDVFVAYGWCTFDVCLLLSINGSRVPFALPITPVRFTKPTAIFDAFPCPCCGTYYDLAGRAMYGPGTDLAIPPHWFSDANTLVIGQAPPDPRYPDGGA